MSIELPEESLREAISSHDWDRAAAILSEHTLSVQRAFDDPPPGMDTAAWEDLIRRQQAFRDELALTRSGVAQLLDRVKRHSVGVRAYRKGGL